MKVIVNIFVFVFCANAFAQVDFSDTTWFDKQWNLLSEKKDAVFYRVYKKTAEGYLVHDKYLNGQDQMIAEASQLKPELISHGYSVYFDEKGNMTQRGNYANDERTGVWVEYYEGDSSITNYKTDGKTEVIRRSKKEPIFTITEVAAEFPGGIPEMHKFIQTNLTYPRACRENCIGGKVFLKFIVNEDGEINNVEVIKSTGNGLLDGEAVRVAKSMPKWKPATMTGKAVKCYFNLPLSFIMPEPYFIFNISNKNNDYLKAMIHINNGQFNKAKELLNEADADHLYLLGVIDYLDKEKRKACKKFAKYIELTEDKSGQKAKVASRYLEKDCA